MRTDDLDPHRALDRYLSHEATDCAEKTVQNHRNRLARFVRWCDGEDVGNLNGLSGRNLHEYRLWRQDGGDPNALTPNAQMSTLRVFLKWCASIEAVAPELYDEVLVPRVDPEDRQRDETLDAEAAPGDTDLPLDVSLRAGRARTVRRVLGGRASYRRCELARRRERGPKPVGGASASARRGKGGERPVAITGELAGVLEDYVERRRDGRDRP